MRHLRLPCLRTSIRLRPLPIQCPFSPWQRHLSHPWLGLLTQGIPFYWPTKRGQISWGYFPGKQRTLITKQSTDPLGRCGSFPFLLSKWKELLLKLLAGWALWVLKSNSTVQTLDAALKMCFHSLLGAMWTRVSLHAFIKRKRRDKILHHVFRSHCKI